MLPLVAALALALEVGVDVALVPVDSGTAKALAAWLVDADGLALGLMSIAWVGCRP